ncbi:MAG TPA: hypothetical protein VFJ07_09305 [Streptosporangiaceae bacterium]|nr:hypothetical protein [Streptosporangiaceae bacterium]
MHLRGLLGALAAAVLAGALAAIPQAAQASVGVGIQAGAVQLSGAAHPGESVALPGVSVVNSGTHPESIRLSVQRISTGPGRVVPASWIQFGSPVVQLEPKHAVRVPVELVVPAGAKPGAYLSDIVATGSSAEQASVGHASLGAAAATLLKFRVTPDAAPGFWWSVFTQTLWALLILILLVAVVLLVHRSGLRVRVERKAAGYGTADETGGWHA